MSRSRRFDRAFATRCIGAWRRSTIARSRRVSRTCRAAWIPACAPPRHLRYYLTANSCHHEGYLEYDWPDDWNIDATSAGPCGDVSPDGTGVPEQFWNCAEVRILDVGGNGDGDGNGGNGGGNDDGDDQGTAASAPEPSPSPTRKPPPVVEMSSGIAIPVSVPTQSAIKGASPPSSAGSHGKTIVGYYASWQWSVPIDFFPRSGCLRFLPLEFVLIHFSPRS